MGHIFVSYSSDDKDIVNQLLQRLRQSNYEVWIDRESIKGGDLWRRQIVEGVESSEAFIIALSQNSIKSDNVRKELDIAVDAKKQIIPVDIESVNIPPEMRYQLAGLQRINFVTDFNNGFSQLLVALKSILSESVAGVGQKKVPVKPNKQKAKVKPETITNSIGMQFKLIPAGEFMMGSEEFEKLKPVHTVKIRTPFYLGIYPVTQREWETVTGNNPSDFEGDNQPVEQVSWDDVQEFIKKLSEKEGTNKYRLPSEAEWEYAARAGTTTQYSFGDDESELGQYAWYIENSGSRAPKKGDYFGYNEDDWLENKWNGKTHPVGQKNPNPWGLYDMYGNVWEWVQDEWHESYDGAPTDGSAWESGSGADRVVRGGGYDIGAESCRSAVRSGSGDPGVRIHNLGFRLLL